MNDWRLYFIETQLQGNDEYMIFFLINNDGFPIQSYITDPTPNLAGYSKVELK